MPTERRPLSTSIVSWYLLIGGAIALVMVPVSLLNSDATQALEGMNVSPQIMLGTSLIFSTISLIAGIAILRRQNWGKTLYIASMPAGLLFNIYAAGLAYWVSTAFGVAVYGVIVFFLMRPAATRWLKKLPAEATPAAETDATAPVMEAQPVSGGQIAGIILMVLAAFFLMAWGMMVYPLAGEKAALLVMSAIMGIPTLLFAILGIFLWGFRRWKMSLGILLASSGGMLLLMGALMWQSREIIADQLRRQSPKADTRFGYKLSEGGFIVGGPMALSGGALIALQVLLDRRRKKSGIS
jgi:hypothetical protein